MATVVGFSSGPVGTEVDYALASTLFGALFVVDSDAALQPSAVTTSDRTVRVNTGGGRIAGLRLSLQAAETVQVPINNTGATRVDAVVARTVWSAALGQPARSTVLTVVPGSGSSLPQVFAGGTPSATAINRQPGIVYDALIAVVEVPAGVGALAASNVFDMRPQAGMGGPFVVPQPKYLSAVHLPVNSRIVCGSNGYTYRLDNQLGLTGEFLITNGEFGPQLTGADSAEVQFPHTMLVRPKSVVLQLSGSGVGNNIQALMKLVVVEITDTLVRVRALRSDTLDGFKGNPVQFQWIARGQVPLL